MVPLDGAMESAVAPLTEGMVVVVDIVLAEGIVVLEGGVLAGETLEVSGVALAVGAVLLLRLVLLIFFAEGAAVVTDLVEGIVADVVLADEQEGFEAEWESSSSGG
ncbi:MAG: hypothetical protein AAFP20_24815 [Cyanobacteria bacterium J06614_10]